MEPIFFTEDFADIVSCFQRTAAHFPGVQSTSETGWEWMTAGNKNTEIATSQVWI